VGQKMFSLYQLQDIHGVKVPYFPGSHPVIMEKTYQDNQFRIFRDHRTEMKKKLPLCSITDNTSSCICLSAGIGKGPLGAGGGRDAWSAVIGKGERAWGWVAAGMHVCGHRETQELCTTSSLFLSWQLRFPVDCDHVCKCLKVR
jgi:hypothetical protein